MLLFKVNSAWRVVGEFTIRDFFSLGCFEPDVGIPTTNYKFYYFVNYRMFASAHFLCIINYLLRIMTMLVGMNIIKCYCFVFNNDICTFYLKRLINSCCNLLKCSFLQLHEQFYEHSQY